MIATSANNLQNCCPARLLADFVAGRQRDSTLKFFLFYNPQMKTSGTQTARAWRIFGIFNHITT
jgi:hypothetical protein